MLFSSGSGAAPPVPEPDHSSGKESPNMYEPRYPHLSSPLKIGSLTLRNRMASAPTSLATLGPGGHPSLENIAYYELRAKGGACIVTMGDVIVHGTGLAHPEAVLLTDPNLLPTLVPVAEAIRRHGAIASIEIDHGGGKANPQFTSDHISHGPSAIRAAAGYMVEPMDVDFIHTIAEAYGRGAAVAKQAGFQMVTLHCGHGWLIHQFLSPLTNHRTDEYGGCLENRTRFMLEVIDQIRRYCGKDFPIEARISGTELADAKGGYTLEDGVEFAKILDGKVDLIHVSTGGGDASGSTRMHPSMFLEHGCNVYLAAEIKKHVKTPVATVGGLDDPEQMEKIISSGQADVVCMARGLIADPYLPKKVMEGRPEDIRPCLRCFNCQGGMFVTRNMRCSVNPIIGNELKGQIPIPLTPSRKVLVVGGGPAGIVSAITASGRGHRVILCEKDSNLGGSIRYAKDVPFKQDLEKYRKYLIRQLDKTDVEVRLNTAATPQLAEELKPDVLICAVGATPIIPSLPGVDLPNVIMGGKAHGRTAEMGDNVVIIGGGLVGTELAIQLADMGKHPIVLEMQNDYAVDSNPQHKNAIHYQKEQMIDFRLRTRAVEITPEGVKVQSVEGGPVSLVKADTVVLAVGYRSDSAQVENLRYCAPEFHWIGDCYKPGKLPDAVHMGYYTALDL